MMVVKYQWDIVSKVLNVVWVWYKNCSGFVYLQRYHPERTSSPKSLSLLNIHEDRKFVPIFLYVVGSRWYFHFKHNRTYFSYCVSPGFSSLSTAEGCYAFLHRSAVGWYSACGTSLLLFVINACPQSCSVRLLSTETPEWNCTVFKPRLHDFCFFLFLFLLQSLSAQVWAVSWHYAFVCIICFLSPHFQLTHWDCWLSTGPIFKNRIKLSFHYLVFIICWVWL